MSDGSHFDLNHLSLHSWDRLYGDQPGLVWGKEPVGFLASYLASVGEELGPQSKILDAACGEGRNVPSLASLPGKIYACDASEQALMKARSWVPQDVEWELCDLRSLPYRNGFFDLVLAADVLQAVPDLDTVLRELARALRPQGLLLCNIPDLGDGIVGADMEPLPSGGYLYQGRYFFRFMSSSEVLAVLETAGFSVIDHQRISWVEPAHPGYRHDDHEHTSVVYLARRNRS